MDNWNEVCLNPVFSEENAACYRLDGGGFTNRYYIISTPETSRLMNHPEVTGFQVYQSLLPASRRMIQHLHEEGQIGAVNILAILRGALNFPMEESCASNGIPVHEISFLSCERVFEGNEIAGLDVRYSKLAAIDNATLLIGDIIASGDTFENCLPYMLNHYREKGKKLHNIVIFTVGGFRTMEIAEALTPEIRTWWPEFEGFIGIFYEGVFDCYQHKGVIGFQRKDVDFYWGSGIVAPEYRARTFRDDDAIFEKCIIYDGGARRYELRDHIEEVSEYWERMLERADQIDVKALIDERLGYETPIAFADWVKACHYSGLDEQHLREVYDIEKKYFTQVEESGLRIDELARKRLQEFHDAMSVYE